MKKAGIALAGSIWLATPVIAQFTYPNCAELKPADFKITEVFSKSGANTVDGAAGMAEPLQMDIHAVKSGAAVTHMNIYFVERLGKVKYFDGAARQVRDVGSVPVWGKNDNGLMGIALHPEFDRNRWMYLWYSPPIASASMNRRLRLGRFTITPDNKLGEQKILIDIMGSKTDTWHSGGPMTFDKHGDLWIQIGNNSYDHNKTGTGSHLSKTDSTASSEWGSSNTASMRGGTIRIHPDDSEKGYAIPLGNFGEYWAGEWEKQGKAALAAEYRDTKKVLPEVYIKGERSNFSITTHPTNRWVAWGTVSNGRNDEFTVAGHPIFSGWPYFQGNNVRTDGHQAILGFLVDPDAPRNISPLKTGVEMLPPAIPGNVNGLAAVAFSGPIYSFDHSLDSKTKFPPHLNNTWIGWDFKPDPHPMWMFSLDSATLKIAKQTRVDDGLFKGVGLRAPTQAKYGPEGSLYIMNYDGFYSTRNPGVTRIDYVGDCRPPVIPVDPSAARPDAAGPNFAILVSDAGLLVREPGEHTLEIYDLSGTRILSRKGVYGTFHPFHRLRTPGRASVLHIVRVTTARGTFLRKITL